MVEVDGDDGGGQILRTSLTLAMLTGKAMTVEGGRLGSEVVRFDPGEPSGGSYETAVGTAGSLTLVFDALLPVATALDAPLELAATGGTDVKWSPPLSFCRRVKLPLLRAHGLAAAVTRPRVRGPQRPAGGR